MNYYDKLTGLNNDALMNEIQGLHNKLAKINPQSSMIQQLQDMIAMASNEYNERMYAERMKDEEMSETIEIGEIESVAYIPDYSDEELFIEITQHYSGDKISQRKKEIAERNEKIRQQEEEANKLLPKKVSKETKSIIDDIPVFGKNK